jgi:hypothetical protein
VSSYVLDLSGCPVRDWSEGNGLVKGLRGLLLKVRPTAHAAHLPTSVLASDNYRYRPMSPADGQCL